MSEKDKTLLMKLFFIKIESATVVPRKFRLQRNVKTGKEFSTVVCLINLLQRCEETGSLEDRRNGEGSGINPSIQSVGISRCDPPRAVPYTGGHSALCRCWICDTIEDLLIYSISSSSPPPTGYSSRVVMIMAGLVTSSSPVALKTRRVGARCKLNLSSAQTSSHWCGVIVRKVCALSGVAHVT
ncbi:hypothetical protein TNCV_3630941 [Trichonephila clavipes]|nr:hypothetical protein TNCV_3630941 [Trichonephila clavipes]